MSPRDLALLVLLAGLWGSSFLFMRIAGPELGAAPLAWMRVTVAAAEEPVAPTATPLTSRAL
jgi:hypothetical protein